MQIDFGAYIISDDAARVDYARVHAWLTQTYWSPGISLERVTHAAAHSSLVLGAYHGSEQAAYMRVISDRATFAYLADVYVDAAHRSCGIASAMIRFSLDHPDHQGLRQWLLGTMDAHHVYERLGFHTHPYPERLMIYRPDQD